MGTLGLNMADEQDTAAFKRSSAEQDDKLTEKYTRAFLSLSSEQARFVFMTSDNMVRLPGCYDVHWADFTVWLRAHWNGVPLYERAKHLAGMEGPP